MKNPITDSLLFSGVYFISFSCLIRSFTSGETQGMLLLISIATILVLSLLYLLTRIFLNYRTKKVTIIIRSVILFAISEIIMVFMLGRIPFFGLTQQLFFRSYQYSRDYSIDTTIYQFQERRDFAFSSAGLLGAISVLIINKLVARNKDMAR